MASEESDRPVIADTGPLHYLVLIGQIEILLSLFGRVTIPYRGRDELSYVEAPMSLMQTLLAQHGEEG